MSLRDRLIGRTAGSSEARLDAYCRSRPDTKRDTVGGTRFDAKIRDAQLAAAFPAAQGL